MEIIGDNIIRHFTTRKIGEGATDADATPTGTVYKNGTATGITVTVAKISTGNYKASFTATAGAGADQFAIGDDWALEISATVDTVVDVSVIAQGTFDTKRIGALQDVSTSDITTAIEALTSYKRIYGVHYGKFSYDIATQKLTIYDPTDSTTPLFVWNLATGNERTSE